MISRIAEYIVFKLEPIATPYFMYCEQQSLPYCVYELANEVPLMTKGGIVGYTADVSIYLVASTEDEAQRLKQQVLDVLQQRDAGYIVNITAMQPAYAEEQWLWKIDFQITQTE